MANRLMAASEALYGFRRMFVMPHTPQANGLAEAAVKKLKLMLDRHTHEYENWHLILPMAQAAVNTRTANALQTSPFVALFGRQPITLTALEQPSLLPSATGEQKEVKQMAEAMTHLQDRLRAVSDEIKAAAVASEKTSPARRLPVPGDKVWLTYSDSERSRYLRKHGHGKPWKHPFVVKRVKPHAVLLDVPKDGSVPEVIPWQSLRKCSFAAPHFHDDHLAIPEVDPRGLIVAGETEADTPPAADREPPTVETDGDPFDPMGWATWSASRKYEIERIVSAERSGRGWRLNVKWVGYPDATPEPLSAILDQTKDPTLRQQIEDCKRDYLDQNPVDRFLVEREDAVPEPTRVQPSRTRERPDVFTFSLFSIDEPSQQSTAVTRAIASLTAATARRSKALMNLLGG